jgi:hypothetical protein
MKDLDLRQQFRLEPSLARRLHEQLEADTRLLSTVRVMNYSMLLGVHLGSSSSGGGGGTASSAGREKLAAGEAAAQGSLPKPPPQQQQPLTFTEHSNAAGACQCGPRACQCGPRGLYMGSMCTALCASGRSYVCSVIPTHVSHGAAHAVE